MRNSEKCFSLVSSRACFFASANEAPLLLESCSIFTMHLGKSPLLLFKSLVFCKRQNGGGRDGSWLQWHLIPVPTPWFCASRMIWRDQFWQSWPRIREQQPLFHEEHCDYSHTIKYCMCSIGTVVVMGRMDRLVFSSDTWRQLPYLTFSRLNRLSFLNGSSKFGSLKSHLQWKHEAKSTWSQSIL